MNFGICNISVAPLRLEPFDTSELVSQVLYGDFFTVLEKKKKWSKISTAFDGYEGWIDNKQFKSISKTDYQNLEKNPITFSEDLVEFIKTQNNELLPIVLGSTVSSCSFLSHQFEGKTKEGKHSKKELINTALLYLNAPYLWGGKTPFGIDCSGFTQMVYKINGHKLLRDANLQATQGKVLSFIEECEVGDLAFFDNEEGEIVHVGIVMDNNRIIHAHGKVRIDKIDHTGIFNVETKNYSHKLRICKRIF